MAETPVSSIAENPELSSLAKSDLLPVAQPSGPIDPEAQAAVDGAQASLAENPLLSSSVSTTINSWTNRSPINPPSARYKHALAYDASSHKVILFGGAGSSGYLNDTWAYDYTSNTWTNRNPANPPSARCFHALDYDAFCKKAILFGGFSTSGNLNDTWAYDYDSNTWTNRNPSNPPPARSSPFMAFNYTDGKMVLFGGRNASGYLNDTWTFDCDSNSWANRNPANAPPARDGHALVYDISAGQVILFGGNTGSVYLNDTWAYPFSASAWTNRNPTDPPPARYGHALAYDVFSSKVILFGGYNGSYLNDTWAYDYATNSWTNRSPANPPPARCFHGLVFNQAAQKVILFGGWNGSTLNDTWAYDYASNTWTNRNPTNPPSARSVHALAYNLQFGKVILFGGFGSSPLNDTWAYDYFTNTWTNRNPANPPPGRSEHALAYYYTDDKVILFGGYGSGLLNDTWAYDYASNTWTNRNPTNPPPARYGHALANYYSHGKVILFGGNNGSIYLNDTWAYDYSTNRWTNRTSAVSPPVRAYLALAYNVDDNKVILFGGYNGSYLNDTWVYSSMRLFCNCTEGWNMITVPLLLEDPRPDALFPVGWPMFAWDALNNRYLGRSQITLAAGVGYWLKATSTQTLTLEGPPNEQVSTSISLSSGWNLIGTPYPQGVSWMYVHVTRGGETKTLAAARVAGWIGPFYRWTGTRYESLSGADLFQPLAGYWMRVFVEGCAIVFPQP